MDHNILKLFVYGSLKVGECNERVLSKWLKSWELASIQGELRLRPDNYPALFLDQERALEGSIIPGQLLSLEPGALALPFLDEFEGYFPGQQSEYLRVAVTVQTKSGPQRCWTYVGAGKPKLDWPILKSWPPEGLQRDPEPYSHGL